MMTKTAVIYTNGSQECERMSSLLTSLPNVSEFLQYRLNEHFTKTQFEMEFGCDATYPQVVIDNQHIGSMKETLQYFNQKGYFK
tara:strand:- start:3758 stop:4009 length:252 start_codon:yes stop_codon:yes gene_type:complete